MWEGLKYVTNYKGSVAGTANTDITLADEPNHYFAHFEKTKDTPASHTSLPVVSSVHTLQILSLQEHQVAVCSRQWIRGKLEVPGKVLKVCVDQLSTVFTKIFNLSLTQTTIPQYLKSALIIIDPDKISHWGKLSDDSELPGEERGECCKLFLDTEENEQLKHRETGNLLVT